MTRAIHEFGPNRRLANLSDEALSLFVGAALTFALFLTMAHLKRGDAPPPAVALDDFRVISLPPELPPPSPVVQIENVPASATITGLDVAAAESPVRISVSIPVLEVPPVPLAPPATIRNAPSLAEIKPKMDIATDFLRVFQQSEVDQRPSVLVNTTPFVPQWVRKQAKRLRVDLLMVIDTNGKVTSVRVVTSSDNPEFDALVVRCVQEEWVFSPAVRKGRHVKCLVQRGVVFQWSSNPFEA